MAATRLDRATREWMERGFGQEFGKVSLRLEPRTPRAVAGAEGETVFVRAEAYRPDTPAGRRLLAHELAHVVQQRLGSRRRAAPASLALVEGEAEAAARAVAAGGRFVCRVADRPGTLRLYGEAGHYYTSYFVMLAAGADNATAQLMAFYCQMPDEVLELDATEAGISIFRDSWPWNASDIARHAETVQQGLHSLTGRPSADETRHRAAQLRRADFPSVEFGAGIHAYGDSFSHRQLGNESRMYRPVAGHAIEAIFGNDPHSPDFIHDRPQLYREYGLGLYEIVREKLEENSQQCLEPPVTAERLTELLDSVAARISDAAQIRRLRQLAANEIGTTMDEYAPEREEECSWEDFRRRPGPALSPSLKDQVLRYGRGAIPRD